MSFRKPCPMSFRKLIALFTLTPYLVYPNKQKLKELANLKNISNKKIEIQMLNVRGDVYVE